ncbi:MAG: 23S rRNA (cytidine(2498)-2'-O)-methyltransferase RlmM [Myxococcaceae bacterium]|nr:23S rRNA (cytidine(2498)-2'-O)-methyltransferase RlmM [Myxococcaceae bacterium]
MRKGHHKTKRRDERRPAPREPRAAPTPVVIPHRVKIPKPPFPVTLPTPGKWLWTCRDGFEGLLYEELCWKRCGATLLGAGLVETERPPPTPTTFARMGFRVDALVTTPQEAAAALPSQPTRVQVWVPDTQAGNARAGECLAWESTIAALREGQKDPSTPWAAFEAGALLGQVCLVAPHTAAVGFVSAREALSLAAGGRARMKRTADAPSRAAMKLDEALEWVGVAPGKGDLCVDLGSAPGGWTRRLLERGARVWSVDTGLLAPDVAKHPRVRHFHQTAFAFQPGEAVDWLFCDMAWRPLEVAQLLAKWARNRWATQLVANIKLPMKDKLPVLLRVRATLEDGGWSGVQTRQLYHDRDEVTVRAVRKH